MIRPVTQNVFDSLMMDIWPRPAAICDFGIDSDEHYAALQTAIREGATINELEEALGNGAKLTALVKKFGSDVQFQTAYDIMLPEPE